MVKKHLMTCAIIMGLFVMATVFAFNMPQASKNLSKEEKITVKDTVTTHINEPKSLMAQLNFADETLPAGDARVEKKMKKTLAAHYFSNLQTNKLHQKAAAWFPIIEPILAAYGIPADFKYMALVESGLHGGVSPKGAAGVWQFMPGTARTYGLKVNRSTDERNNLRKSTVAAAKYIKDLYEIFDSWTLVAAAYNVGDGSMRRAINAQNQDNYFKMKLNRETGSYVYKLISMKQIMENPVRYGYKASRSMLAANEKSDKDKNIE